VEAPVLERIERRSDICVVVPTFRAAAVTAATLRLLRERNPAVAYDVLLVDNGGEDYAAVEAALEEPLSLLVLARNEGGAGAFRLAQERALAAGYRTIVFCDNDAEPLSENGLAAIDAQLGDRAVCGHNDEAGPLERDRETGFAPMIFLAVSRAAVARVGLVDPRYFLQGEDRDYVLRLRSAGIPVLELAGCRYAHAVGKPSTFGNRSSYLVLRGLVLQLHGTLSPVRTGFRVRVAAALVLFLASRLLMALGDPRVLLAVVRGLRDGVTGALRLDLPENRYRYREVPCDGSGADFASLRARLFPRRRYVQRSPRTGETTCWGRPALLSRRAR